MFFNGWLPLGRTAIVGVLAYAALVFLLRISGKRTLSKMNAFDLIVTIALGSTLATVLLSRSVALVTGLFAFTLLVGLQYVITWLSVRSPAVHRFIKAEPALLLYSGRFLREAMRSERVTEAEILAALRTQGVAAVNEVEAVVLETDSSFSVVKSSASGTDEALANVANYTQS